MGVPYLWNVLDPIKTSQSLLLYATEHRKHADNAGLLTPRSITLRLGVDMGTCMAECNAGARAAGVNAQRAGGGLFLFFKRLTEFLKIPVHLIFVFDGPARPPIKRGRRVIYWRPIWWEAQAAAFIRAFGHSAHSAPGEAEAELAKLSIHGLIDGVITSDSDTCLFGARIVMRSLPQANRRYLSEYYVYRNTAATAHDGLPLSQGSFLLIALLCGGDYAEGIDYCGPSVAFGLARCGFGDELLNAFVAFGQDDFADFLIQWRCRIRAELRNNSRGFFRVNHFRLANKITDSFPSYQVIKLYVNPVTSWCPGYVIPHDGLWSFGQPDVALLARLCMQHFHWPNLQIVKGQFEAHLWEGVCLQMMYSPFVHFNQQEKVFTLGTRRMRVVKLAYQKRRGQYRRLFGDGAQPKMLLTTSDFSLMIAPGLASPSDAAVVWAPQYFVPQMQFHQASTSSGDIIDLTLDDD